MTATLLTSFKCSDKEMLYDLKGATYYQNLAFLKANQDLVFSSIIKMIIPENIQLIIVIVMIINSINQ